MGTIRKFKKLLLYVTFGLLVFIPVKAQVTYKLTANSSIQISGTSTVSAWVVKSQNVSGEMIFTVEKRGKGKEIQTGVIKDAKAVLEVSEPPTAMFGQIETGDEIEIALDLSFKESN